MADSYDPKYWDEKADALYAAVAGPGRTLDEYQAIEAPLEEIRTTRISAAKAAFPWAEYWYETDADDHFFSVIRDRMTDDEARQIRVWRVDEHCTWRAVAHQAYDVLRPTWRVGWTMPGHQWVGQMICREAAERLSEDSDAEPWN